VTYSNSYGYDSASNRTSFTAPDNSTVNYGYDDLNRLTNLTDSATGQFTFGYDVLSRRTSLNRPNGVNTSYSYDSLSRLLSVLHQAGTVTLDGATYGYDNAGNRTSKTNNLNNVTENYTYDPTYQLSQVTQGLTTSESYSYDSVGNRLSSQGMSPYSYNSSNQLTSTTAATFTYDANGNTSTKADMSGTTTYTWDFENRLASVVLPGTSGTLTLKYDPFVRRIQKRSASGTTIYLYDGSNSVEELDQTGAELAHYSQGAGIDEPLAAARGGAVGFYEQDGLGSVTTLTGTTGAVLNSYTYDAFGNVVASTGSFVNAYQYTGRDFDSETGLRYHRARYYDSLNGRFLSEDPMRFQAGPDFYLYVGNNASNILDPLGLKPKRWANAKTRPCNSAEYERCSQMCGSKGVESCRVSQTFRVVRWKDGKTLIKWADGPLSCSCHEECDKEPHHYAPPIGIPFIGPIIDEVTDPIVDVLGPKWDQLKNWRPPQPNPVPGGPSPTSWWTWDW